MFYFSSVLQETSVRGFLTPEKYFLALSELFWLLDWKHSTSGGGQKIHMRKKKSFAIHIKLRKHMPAAYTH